MSTPVATPAPPSPDDFLLGGGGGESRKGRSVSFRQIGATITATICGRPETKQKIDPETEKPDTWDNGDPKWQIVVPLQTDLRSLEVENDDGVRFLYISGSRKPESRSMHVAVADAVRAAGSAGLEVGGKLTVTYVADGAKTKSIYNAPKQYTAAYVSAANMALMAPAPAPQQPAAAVTPPPAAAVQTTMEVPYPPYLSPEQVAGLQAAGIQPAQAWQMFPAPAA